MINRGHVPWRFQPHQKRQKGQVKEREKELSERWRAKKRERERKSKKGEEWQRDGRAIERGRYHRERGNDTYILTHIYRFRHQARATLLFLPFLFSNVETTVDSLSV